MNIAPGRRHKTIVCPTLLIAASLSLAEPAVTPKTLDLTLKSAVQIALAPDGNVRVLLANQAIDEAAARARQARAALFPNIDGSASERNQTTNLRTFGFTFPTVPGFNIPTFVGPFSTFDARVSAQQTILDLSILRRYRAAQANVAVARLDTNSTRDQVSDQTARAYLTCLRADASLESARSNVDLSDALVKLANSQKNAGTGTGIEVTRAQVQLSNDRTQLTIAENSRTRAALQLMKTIGLDMGVELRFSDKLSPTPVDAGVLEASIDKAKKERAELKTQHQKELAARLTYGAVRAERLPTIGASGDYGSSGQELNASRASRSVGVSLKVPLFDGGRRAGRSAESLSQYDQERTRTHDLEQQVELEVRLAYASLNSARTEVETAEEGVMLAENELAQARRRYEAGVTNSIEVTDAQTRLARARDTRVTALYDYNLARLDLATSTGSISEYVNQ
jgi:outer membrane protein